MTFSQVSSSNISPSSPQNTANSDFANIIDANAPVLMAKRLKPEQEIVNDVSNANVHIRRSKNVANTNTASPEQLSEQINILRQDKRYLQQDLKALGGWAVTHPKEYGSAKSTIMALDNQIYQLERAKISAERYRGLGG